MPAFADYAANFESISLDTNSGFRNAILPGSFSTLGDVNFYDFQVSGTYYLHATVGFLYTNGTDAYGQCVLTLYHLDSTGAVVAQWDSSNIPTNFNLLPDQGTFSIEVSAVDEFAAGDFAFVLVHDGTGASSFIIQNRALATSGHFDGIYVGT